MSVSDKQTSCYKPAAGEPLLQANLVLIGCPLQTEGLNTQMGGASVCDVTNLKTRSFQIHEPNGRFTSSQTPPPLSLQF